MILRCDVAIVGGGPAGATVARLLARWGYHTVILDSAQGPRRKVGEVLAPSSRTVLEKLGLVDQLDRDPALARLCLGIVSDWGGPHRRDYLGEPGGHGWIVDRAELERRLATEAVSSGADWHWGHRLVRAQMSGDRIELLVAGPSAAAKRTLGRISCAFAVDATGRAAALGRRLGARRQIATRQFAREEAPAGETLHSPGSGWIHISARPDGWSYGAAGPGDARHHIRFSERVQPTTRSKPQRAWEAGFSSLNPACGDRWLAVGDAATAFDPLTSQGLPTALASASRLLMPYATPSTATERPCRNITAPC